MLNSKLRLKLYLILASVSLILLFYSIWQIKFVVVEPHDFLGLASHFTLHYWIGLALLLFCSVLAFLDRDLKGDPLFIFLLIALGLFTFGVGIFTTENGRDVAIYYYTSEASNILATHRIAPLEPPLLTYHAWPATYFLITSLLGVADLPVVFFLKYEQLFWMLCLIPILYAIGKRMGFESNRCFLLAFLALSSWLWQSQISPQGLGVILLLLIFMVLCVPKHGIPEILTLLIFLLVLVLTHGITSLAVLPAVLVLAIYRKEPILFLVSIGLCGAFFVFWYSYQVTYSIEIALDQFLVRPFWDITALTTPERYVAEGTTVGRNITRYLQLSYAAIYSITGIASLFLLISLLKRRKITEETRKLAIFILFWIFCIGLFCLIIGYMESISRFYLYCLVPTIAIVVLLLSSRKVLMVALMILCVAIHLPAYYGGEVVWSQVLTTELKGTEFFVRKANSEELSFYYYQPYLIAYHDNDLIKVPFIHPDWFFSPRSKIDLSRLDPIHYFMISKQGNDKELYEWGVDVFQRWPQTKTGENANLIYNNGYFQIYENSPER